jgi:hypothetical protein
VWIVNYCSKKLSGKSQMTLSTWPRYNTGANKQGVLGNWNEVYSKTGLSGLLLMFL